MLLIFIVVFEFIAAALEFVAILIGGLVATFGFPVAMGIIALLAMIGWMVN